MRISEMINDSPEDPWFEFDFLLQACRAASAGAGDVRVVYVMRVMYVMRLVEASLLAFRFMPVVHLYRLFAPVWIPPWWRSSRPLAVTQLFSYNTIHAGGVNSRAF